LVPAAQSTSPPLQPSMDRVWVRIEFLAGTRRGRRSWSDRRPATSVANTARAKRRAEAFVSSSGITCWMFSPRGVE
jgi:hypothetical protein